jgi:hypothetical protein
MTPNAAAVSVWWAIVAFAVVWSGIYIAWLVAFERWLEPWLRRRLGSIVGGAIVWVPAGGPLRIWGLREPGRLAVDATVGLLGAVAILCSAVLPSIAVNIAASLYGGDGRMAMTGYLTSIPMTVIFVVRVLFGKPDTR